MEITPVTGTTVAWVATAGTRTNTPGVISKASATVLAVDRDGLWCVGAGVSFSATRTLYELTCVLLDSPDDVPTGPLFPTPGAPAEAATEDMVATGSDAPAGAGTEDTVTGGAGAPAAASAEDRAVADGNPSAEASAEVGAVTNGDTSTAACPSVLLLAAAAVAAAAWGAVWV